MKVYAAMAQKVTAIQNCRQSGNTEWEERHSQALKELIDLMPSGSGIDGGMQFDEGASSGEKLVFHFSFHHMDKNGMYDRWTDHTLTVRGSLAFGRRLTISGRNRNDIKEYLYEIFDSVLTEELEPAGETSPTARSGRKL